MTAEVVAVALTEPEARALTDRIRQSAERLWELLLAAHAGKAYMALGYPTWQAYIDAEFTINRVQAYYLVNQGRTIRAIEAAAGETFNALNITIRTATDLRQHMPKVTAEIRDRVADGEEPEKVVDEVVEKYRHAPEVKAGRRQTMARASDEVLGNVVHSLRAATTALGGLTVEQFPDDAPAEQWVREIDKTLRALRSFRSELRRRYDIS